jgi:hypothetical protein
MKPKTGAEIEQLAKDCAPLAGAKKIAGAAGYKAA